jgi:hypothetical protein
MRDYEVEFHRELSERLRITRKTLGLSEREAAEAAGVTVGTYQKWDYIWGEMTLRSFCHELDVSFDWLLDGFGSFHADPYDEFDEDLAEFRARMWRQRIAFVRRRNVTGSRVASSWNGTLNDAGFVFYKNVRH